MPKSKNTTAAYNALFQEHEPPSVGKNERRGGHFMKVDKGQSCHVFAIASAPTWERSNEVNVAYSNIGTDRAMQRLNRQFQHEFAEEDKKERNRDYVIQPFPEPSEVERREERMSNMQEILDVRNLQETVLPVENMYLCGGFREGKMTPEHMWVEDHTNNISYDTFIDRGGIAVVDGVGKDGKPFQPGCEGHAFNGKDIGRIKVDGYTYGQLIAIASGAEKKPPFPDSIANTPQVLMAMETVKLVNEALAKIPGPLLTEDERRVVNAVHEKQTKKDSDPEIKKVIADLQQPEKGLYESAMAKYAEVGRLQREAARAIVGTGFHPFVKLNQDLSAIKTDQIANQITKSVSIEEATRIKADSLEELRKLEEKKGTLPSEAFKEKLQQKIDEARNKIESAFAAKEREPLKLLIQELNNTIKPEQIKQSKSFKDAKNQHNELVRAINQFEERGNALPEKLQGEFKKEIESLNGKIRQEFKAKLDVHTMVSKIETAAKNYLKWSTNNATGWRLTNWSHGSYGREQAQKLLDLIKNEDTPTATILKAANDIVNTSGTNKNSFSRYLHDAMKNTQLTQTDSLAEKFVNYKADLQRELNKALNEEPKSGMRI
ncbi:hypothetical protein Lsan_0360 [Legionella santicrucis]|uniref:Uncharacterized protein n=1 Tax=Legionella santicrucis TaxID=45074 RepID=A0A0W0ZE47_9GAMM|nr:hypothetical protein [Legionella santicrucis]KTD67469.1 hypothetical protein Lsan_0360 [Legionella santicrucis]